MAVYDLAMDSDAANLGRVAELWVFPVKSMQGVRVDRVEVDATGIVGDRRLAVRDLDTGKLVSAKAPSIGRSLLGCAARPVDDQVIVTVGGVDYGHLDDAVDLDVALSALLGRRCALTGLEGAAETYASEWPEVPGTVLSGLDLDLTTPDTSFVDVAPLHLLTRASLAHLGELLDGADLDVRRFRPGILLDGVGGDGFVENEWSGTTVAVGSATITFGAASPRCVMTTLAQPGLDADRRVLQTIAAHNRRDYAGFGDFACLGAYADVVVDGSIAVGDGLLVR
jgi:hypothetical protein